MFAQMNNPIADMRGPDFLALYFVVTAVTIVLARIASRLGDHADPTPPPIPRNPDPYEIAYLRGGAREVTHVAIVELIQRGFLEVWNPSGIPDSSSSIRAAEKHPDTRHLNPLERIAFDFFARPRSGKEIFTIGGLPHELERHCADRRDTLLEQGLLLTPAGLTRASLAWTAGAAVIVGLGGYKLSVALSKGKHNVGGLLVIGVIGLIALSVAVIRPRITRRGRNYLEQLRRAFDKLCKAQLKAAPTTAAAQPAYDPSLALVTGIFGAIMLASTARSDYYEMQKRVQAASASAGGCNSIFAGSSCSSSGCGGASCGGGGCGGGGCGGCGS